MSFTNESLSNLREATQTVISTRRPWREFLSLYAIRFPSSLSEIPTRIGINLTRFLFNYLFIFIFILLLSLVYHPIDMFFIVTAIGGWYYLFFAPEPVSVCNFASIDERILVVLLAFITVLYISFAGLWVNVLVSIAIVAAVVCVHGGLRSTDEGIVDDYESPYGPMLADASSGPYVPV